jgi:hypothetical protein
MNQTESRYVGLCIEDALDDVMTSLSMEAERISTITLLSNEIGAARVAQLDAEITAYLSTQTQYASGAPRICKAP